MPLTLDHLYQKLGYSGHAEIRSLLKVIIYIMDVGGLNQALPSHVRNIISMCKEGESLEDFDHVLDVVTN